jgi:hypothetical protein
MNKIRYRKINNKEYILQTPEYSWFLWKSMIYPGLVKYSKAIRYVAYKYFKEWEYEKWINVLLEFQWFIDNLMNKYDSVPYWILINLDTNITNLETLRYFINNYDLSNELKEKIKLILGKRIDEWLIFNSLKREHLVNRTIFQYSWDESLKKDDGEWYLKYYFRVLINNLFFSVEETELINDKVMYDVILSNWNWSKWYSDILSKNIDNFWDGRFELSLNNYIWRVMINRLAITTIYKTYTQVEQDSRKLRADILERLK